MSYCRFGSGDVYMYEHVGGFIECCTCSLAPLEKQNMSGLAEFLGLSRDLHPEMFEDFDSHASLEFNSRTSALEHLQSHRDAGHVVPEYAFERLRQELKDVGDEIIASDDAEMGVIDLGPTLNDSEEFDD